MKFYSIFLWSEILVLKSLSFLLIIILFKKNVAINKTYLTCVTVLVILIHLPEKKEEMIKKTFEKHKTYTHPTYKRALKNN